MKNDLKLLAGLLFANSVFSQEQWSVVRGKITTPWTEKVDPNNPLPEYPRPQMQSSHWKNKNGLGQ